MRGSWFVWVVVALAVFAGCTEGPGPKAGSSQPHTTAAVPRATDDQGSIAGRVLDDEVRPVVDAQVAVSLGATETTKTDAEGRFTFNGVPAGDYKVSVERFGFEVPAPKNVKVVAGTVAYANFSLTPTSVPVARTRGFITETYIEYGVNTPAASHYGNATGTTYRDIYYKVEADLVGAATGMAWEASPGTAKRMYVELWVADKSCEGDTLCDLLNRTQGLSPLIVRSNEFVDYTEGKKIQINPAVGFNSCYSTSSTTNVAACQANPDTLVQPVFQQRIKLYTTAFFVEPGSPDYNPLPS